jgi:phosphoribosylanthranilate isomerase
MWIKICANTSPADAQLAADSGADAVGFVFAPSPRQVTAEQAARIASKLHDDVTRIGVVASAGFDEIAGAVRLAGLHGTQLHCAPDAGIARRLRAEFGQRHFLVQTLHWRLAAAPEESSRQILEQLRVLTEENTVDAVLLDTQTANASGGTGQAFDWKYAKQVLASAPTPLHIVVAGGLSPANVREAILTLRPWGVDVASGVEARPGQKNPEALRAFITAARSAFAEVEKLTRRTPAVYPL